MGNHADVGDDNVRQACRRVLAYLFFLALVVGFIVYLVLRPGHPRFCLQDACLFDIPMKRST
jgi:hypothetical protein